MKTKNLVLTALVLFIAATVSATKIPTLNVIRLRDDKALVAFEASKPASIEVSLKNNTGETLFYKKSEGPVENFRMVFDFHELNDGTYDVCLNFNNCKINRKVTVSNHLLKEVGQLERSFCPYCELEDNLLKISFLNNSLKNVRMNIYQDGQFVTGKKLGKELCIQKVFDLSTLQKGQYEVVLSSRNNDYQFVINK